MKTWFITGASSGFGRAITQEVLQRGDNVVAAARNIQPLAELRQKHPDRVLLISLDITKPEDNLRALATARTHFGAIDVLVNNAGFSIVGAAEETSEAERRATLELMFFAPVQLTTALLPELRTRGSGTIVQITSVGGLTTAPGFGVYCAAKHALEAWTESLSAEVAPFGIRALIVEPGAFRTKLFGGGFHTMPENPAYAQTVGPMRNFVTNSDGQQPGDPDKAARAIVDAVLVPSGSLRLPLGGDAIDNIRAKLVAVAHDVDASEAVARATNFT